jgi:DNA-directed RNA polymerase specialized sigma24 family protein
MNQGNSDPDRTSVTLLIRVRSPEDAEAWRDFVDRYGPMIRRWCQAWFPHEADDRAQEVLMKLITSLRGSNTARGEDASAAGSRSSPRT